jgi:hypothetical protein
MADNQSIQVRLPDGAEPTHGDVELLRGIFEAIVTLRCAQSGEGTAAEQALTGEGWSVRTRLRWVAEARRGAEFEEVTGASKAEALEHLQQLVRADQVLSAP